MYHCKQYLNTKKKDNTEYNAASLWYNIVYGSINNLYLDYVKLAFFVYNVMLESENRVKPTNKLYKEQSFNYCFSSKNQCCLENFAYN